MLLSELCKFLTLPCAPPALLDHAADAPTFLVADDMEANVMFAQYLLEQSVPGCSIVCASDGAQAVALCTERAFDMIFLDMRMPLMTGDQAARAIHATPRNCHTPILCLTGDDDHVTAQAVLDAGMLGTITKPFGDKAFGAAWAAHGRKRPPSPRATGVTGIGAMPLAKQRKLMALWATDSAARMSQVRGARYELCVCVW